MKVLKIFIAYIILIIIILFPILLQLQGESSQNISYDPTYRIESYDVNAIVNENNVIDVTSTITVDFPVYDKHGIYMYIPYWNTYKDSDGKVNKIKASVTNINVSGYSHNSNNSSTYHTSSYSDPFNFVVMDNGGKAVIKIGSSYCTVYGKYTYVINYSYNMGEDLFANKDEFVFYPFGFYWSSNIDNASFSITMPDKFNKNNLSFWKDKKQENKANINYDITGNTIRGTVKDTIKYGNGIAVNLKLNDGYFKGTTSNYGKITQKCYTTVIVLGIISFLLWYAFGKDKKDAIQTVEFYPPNNLNSAEVGFIYNRKGKATSQMIISLFVDLARKGYLEICDGTMEDNKDKILKDIENAKSNLNIKIKQKNKIIEMIDKSDESYKKALEIKLDDIVKSIELDNKIIEENENKIDTNDVFIKTNKGQIILQKLKEYDGNDEIEKKLFTNLFKNSDTVNLSTNTTLYQHIKDCRDLLQESYKNTIFEKKSIVSKFLNLLISCGSILLFIIGFFVEDMALIGNYKLLYYGSMLSITLIIFFNFIMLKRTIYGELELAKIKGFRKYLIEVEREQLEHLVEKDPKYFYNVLPYAYVLGVSKVWMEKFENIPNLNSNCLGTYNFNNYDSFYDFAHSSAYIPPSYSGSSGGSSCGRWWL